MSRSSSSGVTRLDTRDMSVMVLNYLLSLAAINIVGIGLRIGQSSLLMGPLNFSGIADS